MRCWPPCRGRAVSTGGPAPLVTLSNRKHLLRVLCARLGLEADVCDTVAAPQGPGLVMHFLNQIWAGLTVKAYPTRDRI